VWRFYAKTVWRRALSETWRDSTGSNWSNRIVQTVLVLAPLGGAVGWHLLHPNDASGRAALSNTEFTAFSALLGLLAVMALFFVWHLIVSVPYHLWKELYEKINLRTEQHFADGLVEEVKNLLDQGVPENSSALGAHGYRRVCEFLRGDRSLDSAIEKTKQDVRNYAKRQLTWFRREPDAIWLAGFGEEVDIAAFLQQLALY